MKKKPAFNRSLSTWLKPLFAHMAAHHMLYCMEDQLLGMVAAVEQCQKRRAETIAPPKAKAVRKMARKPMPTMCGYCTYEESNGELIKQCRTCSAYDRSNQRKARKMAGKAKRPEGTCIHGLPFDGNPECPHCIQLMHELTAGPTVNPRRG